MKLAVLDIGTNTVLQLVVDGGRSGFAVLRDDHDIARLGEGVDRTHRLSDEAQQRALASITRHLDKARALDADAVVACGTSAMRDAKNRGDFIALVRERTGVTIEVLSGDDEAALTFTGAQFDITPTTPKTVVLDIGGGSTELALGEGSTLTAHRSIDIGCVRMTERYFTQQPLRRDAIAHARDEALAQFAAARMRLTVADATILGVAGTVTTLAQLVGSIAPFDRERVHGFVLTMDAITEQFDRLIALSREEIAALPEVDPRRADILPAGVLILKTFLDYAGAKAVVASVAGLRYGLAMKRFEEKGGAR